MRQIMQQEAKKITFPKFPEFTTLSLAHQPIIERYTHKFPPYSDYTFASLWCWNEGDVLEVADLHGNLVVKFLDYFSKERFFSFLGDNQIEKSLNDLFDCVAYTAGYLPRLQFIPEHNLHTLPLTFHERYIVEEDRDNHDYIYALHELATMAGGKYQTPRNFINRFTRRYNWQTRVLNLADAHDWQDITQLLESWILNKAEGGMKVDVDLHALMRLRSLLNQVAVFALGLYVDGTLCGYTINELKQQGYATNLFEHANTDYVGVFKFLKKQTALHLKQMGYQYWNHQQDSGFLGLRKSKESFRPAFYLKKLTIHRK